MHEYDAKHGTKFSTLFTDQQSLICFNTANLRKLNQFGESAVCLADAETKRMYALKPQISKVITETTMHGNDKSAKYLKVIQKIRQKEAVQMQIDRSKEKGNTLESSLKPQTNTKPVNNIKTGLEMGYILKSVFNTLPANKVSLKYHAFLKRQLQPESQQEKQSSTMNPELRQV